MPLHSGRTLIIGNPTAKRGEAQAATKQVVRLLRQALGDDALVMRLTEYAGHATELAAALDGAGYTNVIAVGGDGVIHEVVNGLMQLDAATRPILGIVPVGTGNDYAQTLGMQTKVNAAVAQLLTAQARLLDVGEVNGEYFAETLSFGLDAAIGLGTMERRLHSNKTGGALYFEVGIDQLLHHLNTYEVRMSLDGGPAIDLQTVTFAVQVGVTYGGGFKICPDALPDDGVFDICYAEPTALPKAVLLFARAKNGKHVGAKRIHFAQASQLHLSFNVAPPCQADGERVVGTEFDIRTHHHAINVLVP